MELSKIRFSMYNRCGRRLSGIKDYIAVYDKKMLWRANLYIDKKEKELEDRDWNEAHPWNVPCDPATEKDSPWWWDGDGTQT